MATIKDVAKKAGVSITTVSRAFNGYSDVSKSTKEKIFDVAFKLNYTPNAAARNLSSKKKKNFAIVFSGIMIESRKDNIIQSLLVGASDASILHNLDLTVHLINTEQQYMKTLTNFCAEHSVHALIMHGLKNDDPYFEEINAINMPVVLIDIQQVLRVNDVVNVSTDNFSAMCELGTFCFNEGFKEYAVVSGNKNAVVNIERIGGLFNALESFDIDVDRDRVFYADYFEENAYDITFSILKLLPKTNVIFCLSDLMAVGVIKALKQLNLETKILVTGFDGIPIVDYITPKPITVKQNMYSVGYISLITANKLLKKETVSLNTYVEHQLSNVELIKGFSNENI